jgi:hypothetical protein
MACGIALPVKWRQAFKPGGSCLEIIFRLGKETEDKPGIARNTPAEILFDLPLAPAAQVGQVDEGSNGEYGFGVDGVQAGMCMA